MKVTLFTVVLSLMFLTDSQANYSYETSMFEKIRSTELLEIVEDKDGHEVEKVIHKSDAPSFLSFFAKGQGAQKIGVNNVIMVTRELIALGKEVYKIVEAGKPVVNIDSDAISILPKNSDGSQVQAFDLNGWQAPIVKKYRYKIKNYLGVSPVTFDFMLIYSYGGNLDSKGNYITGAQLKPINVDVKWGYKLDASFKVQTIMNQGSSDDPIASAVLMIDYTVTTILQQNTQNRTFFINGLGEVRAY